MIQIKNDLRDSSYLGVRASSERGGTQMLGTLRCRWPPCFAGACLGGVAALEIVLAHWEARIQLRLPLLFRELCNHLVWTHWIISADTATMRIRNDGCSTGLSGRMISLFATTKHEKLTIKAITWTHVQAEDLLKG